MFSQTGAWSLKMNSSDMTTSRQGCYKKHIGQEMRIYIGIDTGD